MSKSKEKKEIIIEFIIMIALTALVFMSLYWVVGGTIVKDTIKEKKKKMAVEMNLTYEKKKEFEEYNKFTTQIFKDKIIDENESDELYEIKKEISQYYEQENKVGLYRLYKFVSQAPLTGNEFDEILNQIKTLERNEFSNLEVTEFKEKTNTFFNDWTKYFDWKIKESKKDIEKPINNFMLFLVIVIALVILILGSDTYRKLKKLKKSVA